MLLHQIYFYVPICIKPTTEDISEEIAKVEALVVVRDSLAPIYTVEIMTDM